MIWKGQYNLLVIVMYWYLMVFGFGMSTSQLYNWRGGRYRCVRKTKHFQVDISFDIGTEEFQELRWVRDWIDLGGLIPGKHDIIFLYAYMCIQLWGMFVTMQLFPIYFAIWSHTLQIIASKIAGERMRTWQPTTGNGSLARINKDIETPALRR